jgi:hypothetical protein
MPQAREGRSMKFSNLLFPDCRPERDGIVIGETLREAWLSDELGVDVTRLAEHHFDGICAYVDPITIAWALATTARHSKIGLASCKPRCITRSASRTAGDPRQPDTSPRTDRPPHPAPIMRPFPQPAKGG